MAASDPSRDLDRDVALAAQAHQRLLAALDEVVDDLVVDGPSRLPEWTRGHVLTHLARNADSHRRMIAAADDGDVADQYEGGLEGRDRAIEQGAGRPARAQLDDLRRSIWALESAWASTPWEGVGRPTRGGVVALRDLPFLRLRETVVHHVDLDIGFELDDLPGDYVRLELVRMEMRWRAAKPMGMTPLPPAALRQPPHRRLGWLLGRVELDGVEPAGIF